MSDVETATDARTAPVAVWQVLEKLRGQDLLDWRLAVTRLGNTSIGFRIEAHGAGQHRITADMTLVFVGPDLRPQPWPQAVRDRITAFKEAE